MSKSSKLFTVLNVFGFFSLTVFSVLLLPQSAKAVDCIPGTVTRDSSDRIANCQLARRWAFSSLMVKGNTTPRKFYCQGAEAVGFHSNGSLAYCTVSDNPIAISENGIRNECPVGMRVFFEKGGYLKFPGWCNRP